METRANHLLVGSFVLIAVVGLFLFVVWIARFQFDTLYDRYQLSFSGHVTGISQGSPVHFQGVPVGQVLEIGFSEISPGTASSALRKCVQAGEYPPILIRRRELQPPRDMLRNAAM